VQKKPIHHGKMTVNCGCFYMLRSSNQNITRWRSCCIAWWKHITPNESILRLINASYAWWKHIYASRNHFTPHKGIWRLMKASDASCKH